MRSRRPGRGRRTRRARFVGEATRAPGSVVLAAMEGSRPLLVEVQALVSPSELVPPRRVANGIDRNRLALVLAVLGRHAGIGVGSADVFVNVAGGVRVDEPGADLAVALAVASAARGVALGGGEQPAGVLRRGRADRRAALGRPPRPAPGRGAQVRPHARDRPERADPAGGDPRRAAAGGGAAEGSLMHETARGSPRGSRRSSTRATPPPASTCCASTRPSKRLTAEQVAERLQGMVPARARHRDRRRPPDRRPVDSIFFRGAFVFGSAPDSIRFRHIRARPASAPRTSPARSSSVTVHGRAVPIDVSERPGCGRRCSTSTCPATGESWASFIDSGPVYARIDAERMFTYSARPERESCQRRRAAVPRCAAPPARAPGRGQQPAAHAVREVARLQPALRPRRQRPGPRVDHHDRGPPPRMPAAKPSKPPNSCRTAQSPRPPTGTRSASVAGPSAPGSSPNASKARRSSTARRGRARARSRSSPVSRPRCAE